ncbi:hypothetical protein B0T26DRAFT_679349 [Lasiosphaeria miniovina]|uniref:Uncharacterized protein n=1 Tax=Lasiosphaeria miniovina TaxID=1954250 RepID=A0AA40A631_9PEZI|nr:uncharacterized protein B0T26DRAFT_679349 [Lasiosphaeria miniovina]KAK0710018.1 hypothetical protein B0T26DRAFT_679349 [Lasiosphaeria miniovina]
MPPGQSSLTFVPHRQPGTPGGRAPFLAAHAVLWAGSQRASKLQVSDGSGGLLKVSMNIIEDVAELDVVVVGGVVVVELADLVEVAVQTEGSGGSRWAGKDAGRRGRGGDDLLVELHAGGVADGFVDHRGQEVLVLRGILELEPDVFLQVGKGEVGPGDDDIGIKFLGVDEFLEIHEIVEARQNRGPGPVDNVGTIAVFKTTTHYDAELEGIADVEKQIGSTLVVRIRLGRNIIQSGAN